ncbi:AAA family ATPase [Rhodovulum sp. DZ06]|uniref:AAA family ATPase n=1 Tax=Rhodovulum sp. DZ06 TaxID=3425126 RepID=UPI003D35230B
MQLPRLRSKPVEAIVVADDFATFDALPADLDAECGDGVWSVVKPDAAISMISDGAQSALGHVIVCVDSSDPDRIAGFAAVIGAGRAARIPVILLVKEAGPAAMHTLMRAGADDFLPYPAPPGELVQSIQRLRERGAGGGAVSGGGRGPGRRGMVLPVYSMSGGAGGTCFAVNLAWELALLTKGDHMRVALIDLDFQFGSVATYLDLPRQESLMELLASAGTSDGIDRETMAGAFTLYDRRMHVMTSPTDALPIDAVTSDELAALLDAATAAFDFVIVDLPHTLTTWTETVLSKAETFFCLTQMDMRSAQNTLRFLRILKSEDLPLEKLEFVMNHSPGFTDVTGRGRMKRMAESLGIEFAVMLPDGGKQVLQACDHGQPLEVFSRGNALRKEIRKVAQSMKDAAAERRSAEL